MSQAFNNLIAQFTRLPGVGLKTAQRYAYAIISMSDENVAAFTEAITCAKATLHYCSVCGNYTDSDVCDICSTRDSSVICVVKEPKDVTAFEKVKDYRGVYHVLHGVLNPLHGVGMNDIHIKQLLSRLDGVKEIIMALSPDVEGEATSMCVAGLVKPLGVKITRLSQGIPIGSDIEYADENTLLRALNDRREM